MALAGFDDEFEDLPDYILKITKRIWEDRHVDAIRTYYSDAAPVRSPSGVVVGAEAVVAATMATLSEFPDRRLYGEDVIWCGSDADGYFSSHRILSTATHAGDGAYGVATGTALTYRIIADCACRHNQVYDEWLVRDHGAVVRQLGLEPKRYAADRIANASGPDACPPPLTPGHAFDSEYKPTRQLADGPGSDYAALLERVMAADFAAIRSGYDRAVQQEQPGGITAHGHDAVDAFWLSLRASFPDARFKVEHVIGRSDAGRPPRAALRWSLTGRHSGVGAFGPPSGAEVYVLGISHAEFGTYGINREWVLFDESAIWQQILMHSG